MARHRKRELTEEEKREQRRAYLMSHDMKCHRCDSLAIVLSFADRVSWACPKCPLNNIIATAPLGTPEEERTDSSDIRSNAPLGTPGAE